jgi:DNA (cytosine-5)-methyltransferase 1
MTAYYNEIDPFAAQWLRNLISQGLIASGDVDERSIKDVKADEIKHYTQVHLFAGIGGWSIALRLAGWPDGRPVWSGSCPCQPFSCLGKRTGYEDERDLWPEMFRLIKECKPNTVFGEQVEDAIEFGWLDRVFDDVEGIDYAFTPLPLPACCVGSPQKRNRIYFVAHSASGNEQQKGSWSDEWPLQNVPWESYERLATGNGRALRNKPGLALLENGVQRRTFKIRAYGNAIVPQVAAKFIRAFNSIG